MMLLRRADKRRRDDITDVVGKVDAGWESAGGAKELLEIHAHALAINVLSPLIPVVRCHKRVTQPYESDSTGLKRLGWWVDRWWSRWWQQWRGLQGGGWRQSRWRSKRWLRW